jgi:hypothetical protein
MSDSPTKRREKNAGISGDTDMRIAADGTWLHCGSPIGRAPLVQLFAGEGGSAPRLARPLRGGEQRFTVRHHVEALLQLGGTTMYDTRTDDGIALELDRQSFQEGVGLQGMDRRCGPPASRGRPDAFAPLAAAREGVEASRG